MAKEKPAVNAENAHFLKGHASWLYCDNCNKTIAYLCYVTYRYFHFSFNCSCGCEGFIENKYDGVDLQGLTEGKLVRNAANKRFCCEHDESPLFSPVPKNLKSYSATIICGSCNTKYSAQEIF